MFVVSELTGNIYKNGILVPVDESNLDYQEFLIALQNGEVSSIPYTQEEFAENIIIQAIRDERNAHSNRIIDGQQKYSELVARLRIAQISNTLTQVQYDEFKELINPLRSDLISGDWKEALVKLEEMENSFANYNILDVQTVIKSSMIEYISYNYVTYDLTVPTVVAKKTNTNDYNNLKKQ